MKGRIFITGGTGSLGNAILQRAKNEVWPCNFTIYSRDEVKQGQLKSLYPEHHYILGDVRDEEWLALCMRRHDLVIHAAAYKQVPATEVNVVEAVEVNVLGSRNVARAAVRADVKHVVGISTDKACAPINAYGQSKALMEKVFAQACQWGDTAFNCVRYGNVLGSRGSVVPFFERQALMGWLTVTDPEMTRFWLTLNDAVNLVAMGFEAQVRGSIIVPKARASSMAELAKAVAPMATIKVIGAFAGEKKHEQLVHGGESHHADEQEATFEIWPAYTSHRGSLPQAYEYRSDTALRLSVEQLREMLAKSRELRHER